MSQLGLLGQRAISGIKNIFGGKQGFVKGGTPFATGGSGLIQSAKSGFGAVSSGTSGRILTAGVGVGAGTAAAGTGIGFGVQQVSEPLFDVTDKIDEQLGFTGVGSMVIIGIIILAVILLLRMVIK